LSAGLATLSFHEADGKALPFPARTFDVVVFHTVLSHVPGPEALLAEAFRVLRPQGSVGIGDGDWSTATVALGPHDPLQTCVEAFVEHFVHAPWLVRRLPALAHAAGFVVSPLRTYGIVETLEPRMTPTWVERGVEALLAVGRIGAELAAALKAERTIVRRRGPGLAPRRTRVSLPANRGRSVAPGQERPCSWASAGGLGRTTACSRQGCASYEVKVLCRQLPDSDGKHIRGGGR
jgi:SAM-dependent methyltransferase